MEQDLRDVKMVDGYLYRINEDQTLELVEEKIANERIEDLQADCDCHASPEDGCECGQHKNF